MRKELRKLREQRNTLAQSMRDLCATAEGEKRGLNDEERGVFDGKTAEIDVLDERIENLQNMLDLGDVDLGQADDSQVRDLAGGVGGDNADTPTQDEQRAAAFGRLLRSDEGGLSGLGQDDRQALRAMATGTGAAGGFTVPTAFATSVFETMLAYGGIAQRATILNTDSGSEMLFPTMNDTGNIGEILAENDEDSDEDAAFGQRTLGAYKYTSKIVRVSIELLQDTAVNIEELIPRLLGERIGRATAKHYAAGTGAGQPTGLFTSATAGVNAALRL